MKRRRKSLETSGGRGTKKEGGSERVRERERERETQEQSKLIKPTTGESVGPVSHANFAQSAATAAVAATRSGRFKK
jgi:hypothetical protein